MNKTMKISRKRYVCNWFCSS